MVTIPMSDQPSLALLGFGVMGQALAGGLLKTGLATRESLRVGVRRPQVSQPKAEALGLTLQGNLEAARGAAAIVLCVKPKDVEGLLTQLREGGALDHHPLVISIAAGVATARLAPQAPGCPLVRAMPNTPCAIGKGAIVLARGPLA